MCTWLRRPTRRPSLLPTAVPSRGVAKGSAWPGCSPLSLALPSVPPGALRGGTWLPPALPETPSLPSPLSPTSILREHTWYSGNPGESPHRLHCTCNVPRVIGGDIPRFQALGLGHLLGGQEGVTHPATSTCEPHVCMCVYAGMWCVSMCVHERAPVVWVPGRRVQEGA